MANDVADWTGQQLVQLVSQDGTVMGDNAGATLAVDVVTETLLAGVAGRPGTTAWAASFKPAVGATILPAGVPGAFTVGTDIAAAPPWDAAPAAGDFGLAYVTASGDTIATAAGGWTELGPISSDGQTSIWYKPVLGAAEAAPTFTSAHPVAGEPMMAQLLRFTGVLAAGPLDQSNGVPFGNPVQTVPLPAMDASFGDLVVAAFNWPLSAAAAAQFADSLNNGAAVVNAGNSGAAARTRHSSFVYGITVAPAAAIPVGVASWAYDVVAHHAPAVGAQASVVLPAVAGKAYTLGLLSYSMSNSAAAAAGAFLQVLDGAAVIFEQVMAVSAGNGVSERESLTGLGLRGTPGNTMTVRFSAALANVNQRVNAGAYLR